MASFTAVELGGDTWTLARLSVRGGDVNLLAVDTLDPAAFPGIEALTIALRRARRTLRLPRRCRAVVWGLPDGATRKDTAVKPLLVPLVDAGFRIERVVSPCNALAALARSKTVRGDGSVCWVAINRGGVAIVAVRPGKLIYSHSFTWDSTVGAVGSQARLLQRYSLVAFLAPELKRAIAEARTAGTPVGAVVTCGNLPDLRALTMPLIEELDLEVETLDTLDGLIVKPPLADKLREVAPAIRVACAAAFARGTRPWDPSKKKSSWLPAGAYVRAAVAAAAIAGLGYLWYVKTRPAAPVAAPAGAPARPSGAALPRAPITAPPARTSPPTETPPVSMPAIPADPDAPVGTTARGPTRSSEASGVPREGRPIPLTDPVPKVTGILVSKDRRFATVAGGRIIAIGDRIGRRTVVSIDERGVVLQEPSGVQLRVGLRGRVVRLGRGVR